MIQAAGRVLGVFSIALGVVQLLTPGRLLRSIGIRATGGREAITRLIGLRELSVAPGLLTASRPVGWLAARVAGDVMDIGLLAVARRAEGSRRSRLATVMVAVAGILAVDLASTIAAHRAARARSRHPGRIVRVVTVNRPVDELYRFWRNLENLPRVMPHLESVVELSSSRSHWTVRAPLGASVEWDAEIVEDLPNELVAWRSVEGSEIRNAGRVRFAAAPRNQGTEVSIEMEYEAPGGAIGSAVAMLTGEEPRQQVSDALRRFKQVMETGEPIRSEATADGRRIRQRPAQPPQETKQQPMSVEPAGAGARS